MDAEKNEEVRARHVSVPLPSSFRPRKVQVQEVLDARVIDDSASLWPKKRLNASVRECSS